jgi:ferritin-like metal-binding protein YciE
MTLNTLHDLMIEELKDIYSAETQILKALPEMVKHATNADLKKAFEDHLTQTKGHVTRLDTIFGELKTDPKGTTCKAMEGILAEAAGTLAKKGDPIVLDAAIIGDAQRVEHYEIAAYGAVHAYAVQMKHDSIAKLLQATLTEEEAANDGLTAIAKTKVNNKAPQMRELQTAGK